NLVYLCINSIKILDQLKKAEDLGIKKEDLYRAKNNLVIKLLYVKNPEDFLEYYKNFSNEVLENILSEYASFGAFKEDHPNNLLILIEKRGLNIDFC
ncbi:MAG: hypothetical protein K940chlam1_01270, partial [Candidatus Anoxychlamydiales bacterium]|nr:hypothetical protein [Candidatus Anoxychlamydiales bacterium]